MIFLERKSLLVERIAMDKATWCLATELPYWHYRPLIFSGN